jgi:hypothetical protein
MSNVTNIWLVVQTASGSEGNLNLIVKRTSGADIVLPTVAQQTATNGVTINGITNAGTAALFSWKQGVTPWTLGAITSDNLVSFELGITGPRADDAWRPSAIWVMYLTDTGAYSLGPQNPNWDGSCFSSQVADCGNTAKQKWPLPWNQLDPIVAFDAGAIAEARLEPKESARYNFKVSNLSPTVTINNVVLGLKYNKEQFDAAHVYFDVAAGSSGLPEINVPALIPPGGSAVVSVPMSTREATLGSYTFDVQLLALTAIAGETSKLYVDNNHKFTVVAS